jgi:hypothetical protein
VASQTDVVTLHKWEEKQTEEERKVQYMHGLAMAQAVSRRPLIAEARVRARFSPCVIYGGQIGIGTGLSTRSSVLPVDIISLCFCTLIYIYIYHLEGE